MSFSRVYRRILPALFVLAPLGALPACSSSDRPNTEGTTASSALTMQATTVRDFAGTFVVGDGTLYRFDRGTIYAGEIARPETDRVLAQVPITPETKDSDVKLLLTNGHLVFWNRGGAWQVPRSGGAIEALPRGEYEHSLRFPIHSDGNGGLLAFGYSDSFRYIGVPVQPIRDGFFRIDHLAEGAAAWSPLVSSTRLTLDQGWQVGSNFVDTTDFTFGDGKVVGLDKNWGPYVADPGTSAFRYLARDFWVSHMFGSARTSFALRGNTLHVLVGVRVMRSECADPSELVTLDVTGAQAPTVVDLPPGGFDLVVTGDEAYFQSFCTDDVYRTDLTTGVLTSYRRPLKLDATADFPLRDQELRSARQRSQRMAVDGGNIYFVHDESIRSIPAH